MRFQIKQTFCIAALPLLMAGCASPNPKSARTDAEKMAASRLPAIDTTNQSQAQIIAGLLQTNLTVQSAVTIAVLNNQSLQAEFEEIGISQATLAQASRLHNIQIFGSWRFPNQPPSPADIEYSASADFLDLLTLPSRKKFAAQNLEQTKLEVANRVLQLAAETQMAFYRLQAQTALTNRLGEMVELNEATADLAQRQYDAGNITSLELHNQQAPALQTKLDLLHARAEVLREREQLNRLLGLSSAQLDWTLDPNLSDPPKAEPPLENLESLAVQRRFDLAAARRHADSLAAALRLKKHTRYIPGVSLGVDTERTPDGQRVTGPTLGLELPVFDQGQPAVAKLSAEFRQANDNYSALETNVRSEIREAHAALLAAREAVQFTREKLLPLRQQILGETLLQYNAMQKNGYDLLLSREHEQTVEQTYVEILRDYWLARVQLETALGGRLDASTTPPTTASLNSPTH